MKIYKYTVAVGYRGLGVAVMPDGARILSIATQGTDFVAWALVDPSAEPKTFTLRLVQTGGTVPAEPEHRYINTIQDGIFVWHFFEVLS